LIDAQAQAVFFNSAISSLAVGARLRLNASTNCVPVHCVPVSAAGIAFGASQAAKRLASLRQRFKAVENSMRVFMTRSCHSGLAAREVSLAEKWKKNQNNWAVQCAAQARSRATPRPCVPQHATPIFSRSALRAGARGCSEVSRISLS